MPRTKPITQNAPAAPKGPTEVTTQHIIDTYRYMARFHADSYAQAHAKFLKAVEESLKYDIEACIAHRVVPLTTQQAKMGVWQQVVQDLEFVSEHYNPTTRERLEQILKEWRSFADNLLNWHPWDINSTCPVHNAMERAKLTGKADAWKEISITTKNFLDETKQTIID